MADQFNDMAGKLQESYADLENKVELRTRELTESLEQQTATSDVLRVISSSPGDLQLVRGQFSAADFRPSEDRLRAKFARQVVVGLLLEDA